MMIEASYLLFNCSLIIKANTRDEVIKFKLILSVLVAPTKILE